VSTLLWIILAVFLASVTYLAGVRRGRRQLESRTEATTVGALSTSTSVLPVDSARYKERIPDEHFWFSAITLSLNAFLISHAQQWRIDVFPALWVGFLNLYALYLVVHRAASHAGKLVTPTALLDRPQRDRTYQDKWTETKCNLHTVLSHVPFVICEGSGALFYILCIVTSYFAVLFAHRVL